MRPRGLLDKPTPRLYCDGDGARYPSGKGEVCKTFIRRFDSDPRLQFLLRLPRDPSLCSGFRLRAPASLTHANRLKFDSDPRLQFLQLRLTRDPSLCSGFRLRAPASLTPANRLKFDSHPRLQNPAVSSQPSALSSKRKSHPATKFRATGWDCGQSQLTTARIPTWSGCRGRERLCPSPVPIPTACSLQTAVPRRRCCSS